MSVKRAKTAVWQGVKPCFMLLVSTLFVCLAVILAGCKRQSRKTAGQQVEIVYTNRMDDAGYRGVLHTNRLQQGVLVSRRQAVVDRMERMVAEVREALPAGADDEAVKAELAKSEEWRTLEAENLKRIGEIEEKIAEARTTVRERLLREQRDVKAVAEGRARPVAVDSQP